jgi:hypothetical protein
MTPEEWDAWVNTNQNTPSLAELEAILAQDEADRANCDKSIEDQLAEYRAMRVAETLNRTHNE